MEEGSCVLGGVQDAARRLADSAVLGGAEHPGLRLRAQLAGLGPERGRKERCACFGFTGLHFRRWRR